MEESIIINSLQEYREITQKTKLKHVFRGEVENDTPLTTSIGRFFEKINFEKNQEYITLLDKLDKEEKEINNRRRKFNPTISLEILPKKIAEFKRKVFKQIEKNMFDNFIYEAFEYNQLSRTEVFNLALAQHYGLKTRLLDWTKDPFVALYFSLENPQKDSLVYSYKPSKIFTTSEVENTKEETEDFVNIFNSNNNLFFRPPKISRRISVQSAVLQLFAKPEESFFKKENHNSITVYKIPKGKIHKDIKNNLEEYQYNKQRLFPDLDHLSEFLNKKFLPNYGK